MKTRIKTDKQTTERTNKEGVKLTTIVDVKQPPLIVELLIRAPITNKVVGRVELPLSRVSGTRVKAKLDENDKLCYYGDSDKFFTFSLTDNANNNLKGMKGTNKDYLRLGDRSLISGLNLQGLKIILAPDVDSREKVMNFVKPTTTKRTENENADVKIDYTELSF